MRYPVLSNRGSGFWTTRCEHCAQRLTARGSAAVRVARSAHLAARHPEIPIPAPHPLCERTARLLKGTS